MQIHFHMKGFARVLLFKQRHKLTRKWHIDDNYAIFAYIHGRSLAYQPLADRSSLSSPLPLPPPTTPLLQQLWMFIC